MATLIDMPKLSDTMTVGTLVRWLKNEGDAVANGDMIAEVETDKATMEVECFDDGILIKQYCGEGAEVAVGDPIAAVGEAGEEAPAGTSSAPAKAAAPVAPAPVAETPTPAPAAPVVEAPAPAAPAPVAAPAASGTRIKASPLAKRIAEDKGVVRIASLDLVDALKLVDQYRIGHRQNLQPRNLVVTSRIHRHLKLIVG